MKRWTTLCALALLIAAPIGIAPRAVASPSAASSAAASRAELDKVVEQAMAAVRTDPEALLRLTNQALALLATQPDADLETQVRVLRCYYYNERDRAAVQREIERANLLAPTLRNAGVRAAMLGCEGEMYEQAGENTRAMALYEQAVSVAEAAHDDRHLAEVLFLRGYLRGVVGDFPKGLADLKRALVLYQKLDLPVEVRTTMGGVAGLYTRMGALDEARGYYEDALRAMPAGTASREHVVAQHNLARNLQRLGRLDEAQRHFEQVLAQARELKFARGQAYALRGLATVRNAKRDAARALQFVEEAQRLSAKVPDEPLRGQLLVQRAKALRLLGRPADGQAGLREAIRIFAAGDAVGDEAEAHEELARVNAALGDWRQAYEEQSRARDITHDLLRKQLNNRFATMKAQFDADAKEREVELLQRENQAGERALAEQRRAARLQVIAIALASALALLLAALAWRQHRSGRLMRTLAMTDELTGLPNRRGAIAELERLIATGESGALLILDIDHFKRINDQHGHAAGDSVLRAIAHAWRDLVGNDATLGRLGGEEFVAVARGCDLVQAKALAERLREAVPSLDMSGWLGTQHLTTSVGVTALTPGDTVAAALARADAALYRAKDGGRNRVEALA